MEYIEKTLVEQIKAFLGIVRRHKYYMLIPFVSISIISAFIAMKLPHTYVSKGTILVEDRQQMSQGMLPVTVTGFTDERIKFIQQRIMTRERILSIVEKYQLYSQRPDQLTQSELIKNFENNVSIDMIAVDAERGEGKVTIAFTISFSAKDPITAQKIASELVDLFMAENSRVKTQRAAKTTEFFSDETNRVNQGILDIENKIAGFKEKFGRSLPELLPSNLTAVERVTGDLRQTENQMNLLKERIAYLTASLPRIRQEVPVNQPQNSQNPLSKAEQLRGLKAEYVRLSGRYNLSHPDIVRVARQIKALESTLHGSLGKDDAPHGLDNPEKNNHLSQQLTDISTGSSDPIYINLLGQLNASQSELKGLEKRHDELQVNLTQLNTIISQTPKVERSYNELMRERETSLVKFNQLKSKVQEAKLAQKLEEEQKGESFSLIEPPALPDKPEKGIRKVILLTGLVASLLVGFGLTILAESFDSSVHGAKDLHSISGIPPMIVIPYIENDNDLDVDKRRIKFLWIGGLVLMFFILFLIHIFVIPLDNIWYRLT